MRRHGRRGLLGFKDILQALQAWRVCSVENSLSTVLARSLFEQGTRGQVLLLSPFDELDFSPMWSARALTKCSMGSFNCASLVSLCRKSLPGN